MDETNRDVPQYRYTLILGTLIPQLTFLMEMMISMDGNTSQPGAFSL
jgi:hypothetical protein